MKRSSIFPAAGIGALLLIASPASSADDQEWTAIMDMAELTAFVSGRTMLMYKTRTQYYRPDGNMVEHFRSNDALLVRQRTLDDKARLCWHIFTIPDRVIDCSEIQRSSADPDRYRYKWINAQGAPPLELAGKPSKKMIDVLNEKAGLEQ